MGQLNNEKNESRRQWVRGEQQRDWRLDRSGGEWGDKISRCGRSVHDIRQAIDAVRSIVEKNSAIDYCVVRLLTERERERERGTRSPKARLYKAYSQRVAI